MINFIKKYPNFFVIIAYLILTLVMTVPVVFKINTEIPDNPNDNDAFQIITRITNLEKKINLETFTDYLYFIHPEKILNINNHLLILHLLFDEPLAYNIFWLLSFVLSGFGMYLLVKYLVKDKIAAFLAGFIYSFSSYHFIMAVAGHFGATHIEFIPFFILFLIKYFKKANLKNIILSLIFFLLIIKNEPHHAAHIIIFVILFFIYQFIIKKNNIIHNKKFIIYSSITLIIGIIVMLWQFLPLLKITYSEINYLKPPFHELETSSNDVVATFTPLSFSHLESLFWGNFFSVISEKFTITSPYVGYTVIFFIVLACIYKRKETLFWFFVAFIFYIFSLGPFLHFAGLIEPKIPMPYLFLYHYVPWFDNIRMADRMFVLCLLATSILSGVGIKYFLEKYNKFKSKLVIPFIIFILLLLEFAVMPINTISVDIPHFYNKIAEENENFSVMQVPGSTSYAFASLADYYNTAHNKKTINDYDYARIVPGRLDFQKETPIISDILHKIPNGRKFPSDIIVHPQKDLATDIFNHYNIKYIIIHKDYITYDRYVGIGKQKTTSENYIYLRKFIEENIDTKISYEDKQLIAYEIDKKKVINPYYLALEKDTWHDLQEGEGYKIRQAKDESILNFNNLTKKNKKIKLDFSVQTETNDFKKLEILVNDNLKEAHVVGPKEQTITLFISDILPGKNTIKFRIFKNENELINENDKSIMFSKINYKEVSEIITPELYASILNEDEEFSILPIPFYSNYSFNASENKVISNKKIITLDDFVVEKNGGFDFSANYYLFKNLFLLPSTNTERIIANNYGNFNKEYYREVVKQIPSWYNLKYIIFKKNLLDFDKIIYNKKLIEELLEIKNIKEDDQYIAYELNKPSIDKYPLFIGDNWSELSRINTSYPIRKISNMASLILVNPYLDERDLKFSFKAQTNENNKPKFLKVHLNDQLIDKYTITTNRDSIEINLQNVKPGKNTINFYVLDEYGRYFDDANSYLVDISDLKIE